MEKVNKMKGITLIALVITIIILLILAGISIQSITNTGIFGKASQTKKEAMRSQIIEWLNLKLIEEQTYNPLGTSEEIIEATRQNVNNNISELQKMGKTIVVENTKTEENGEQVDIYFYVQVDEDVYKVDIKGAQLKSGNVADLPSNTETYTISYDANGGEGAPESQIKHYGVDIQLSSIEPTRDGYTFLGWAEGSTSTSVIYEAGATYQTNSNLELFAVWGKDLLSTIEIGDYIRMSPSNSEYSELNLWRVIAINSDETIDMVSNYTSSSTVTFAGDSGVSYSGYLEELNKISAYYTNENYVLSTRCPKSNASSTSLDRGLINSVYGNLSATTVDGTNLGYWLYFQWTDFDGDGTYYYCVSVGSDGNMKNNALYYGYANGARLWNKTWDYAIRPIVTLKSGLIIKAGEGTEESPWILN